MTSAIPSLGFPSRGSRVRPRLPLQESRGSPCGWPVGPLLFGRRRSRCSGFVPVCQGMPSARSRHPVMVVLRLLVVRGTPVPTLAGKSNERAKRPRVAGTTEFRGLTRVRRRERCGIGRSRAASVSQRDVGGLVGWFRPPLRADEHGASETADKAGRDSGAPAARLHDPVPRHSAGEVSWAGRCLWRSESEPERRGSNFDNRQPADRDSRGGF